MVEIVVVVVVCQGGTGGSVDGGTSGGYCSR